MKDNENILILREIEQLCRLYMDCGLSVQEETELQYVLGQVDYRTPLIDDVRAMMGIQLSATLHNTRQVRSKRSSLSRILRLSAGVAAALAMLIGLGVSFIKYESPSDTLIVAYAHGCKLSQEQALRQSEADMEMAEAFIQRMTELENREQKLIDDFFNNQSL